MMLAPDMDLLSEEGLNEIRRPLYRVSIKLLCLQERLHMKVVSLQHIWAAFCSVGRANLKLNARQNRQEVTCTLSRMFQQASQEVEVDQKAVEEICSLTFRLFDRTGSGGVLAASLKTLLIVLSGDSLQDKYTALVKVARERAWSSGGHGSISRSGLESLLQDLSQVPMAVQEKGVASGTVDAAVTSCFHQVSSQTASPKQVISWLGMEPPLLQWLPALSRLSLGRHLCHDICCHCCKTRPITGLRYRCLRCVNVQVCQNCFLKDRYTKRHKRGHPVLEMSTEPTWRESLTSLFHRSGHTMSPRQLNHLGVKGTLMWAESPDCSHQVPHPPDFTPSVAAPAVSHHVSLDALCSSKCVQTEELQVEQETNLQAEIRDLQRDKWLLDQQLQAWRISVLSEQSILEKRCAGVEGTVEALRRETRWLEGFLTQVVQKPTKVKAEEEEEEIQQEDDEKKEDNEEEEIQQEDDDEDENEDKQVIQDRYSEKEVEPEAPQQEKALPHREMDDLVPLKEKKEEEENRQEDQEVEQESVSVEQRLQQAVIQLRNRMEKVDSCCCSANTIKRGDLEVASGRVRASIHHLVDAVRTTISD